MTNRLVLVAFPFNEQPASKVRPALCLTEPRGLYRHVVVAFVTSRIPTPLEPTDIPLRPDDPAFGATGLRRPSTIRLHRLLTVTIDQLQRELGILSPALADQVRAGLRELFRL